MNYTARSRVSLSKQLVFPSSWWCGKSIQRGDCATQLPDASFQICFARNRSHDPNPELYVSPAIDLSILPGSISVFATAIDHGETGTGCDKQTNICLRLVLLPLQALSNLSFSGRYLLVTLRHKPHSVVVRSASGST